MDCRLRLILVVQFGWVGFWLPLDYHRFPDLVEKPACLLPHMPPLPTPRYLSLLRTRSHRLILLQQPAFTATCRHPHALHRCAHALHCLALHGIPAFHLALHACLYH